MTQKKYSFKVAPRVEKTEKLKFCKSDYFASCIMKKLCFLLGIKEIAFFSYFYHEIISYSAELFDCELNFKFFLDIFKSNIKGAIFGLGSSHVFRDQPYTEVLEVKYQSCNFTSVLSFKGVFGDFGHIFPTCFCRT